MGNCCRYVKDKPTEESPFDINDSNEEENPKKILKTEEEVNNISSSPTFQKNNPNEGSQKNPRINLQKNSLFSLSKLNKDKPNIMDAYIRNDYIQNYDNLLLSESKSEDNNNQLSFGLLKMERKLFNLINNLRTNPKSFIPKIEEYKNKLRKNKDFYYLIIDDNIFTFKKGNVHFDECINFLKEQKSLKIFDNSPSMFESKMLFKDKNISDLYFVLIYNLIDIKSTENNKIKRNCIMSDIYKKLNITIVKDDFISSLYTFYFSFDQ